MLFYMRRRYKETCSKIPEHEFVRWNNQWIFLHIKSISWIFIRRSHDGRDAGVHVNACCPRLLRCRRLNDVIGGNDVIASHRWRHVHSEQLKHGPPCSFVDILPARRCASAGTIAMALCLSVCLSVCHKSVFYRNGWTNRAGFWPGSFLPPILHCVIKKFGYLQK